MSEDLGVIYEVWTAESDEESLDYGRDVFIADFTSCVEADRCARLMSMGSVIGYVVDAPTHPPDKGET